MQIGTMEIMGTINIENIKTGLTQMKKSFSDIKMEDLSPSVNLDNLKTSFSEINTQSISLADNMSQIGTSASFENINTSLDLTKYSLGGVQTQTKSLAESMKKLGGSVYTEGVTRGLTQMKNSLSSAKVQAKSLFGDMNRLGGSLKGIGKTAAVAGAGFFASLLAAATVAPGIIIGLERMKHSFWRIGMVIGETLAPQMKWLADRVENLASFTESHPIIATTLAVAGFGLLSVKLLSLAHLIPASFGVGSLARGAISGLIGLIGSIPLAPVITIAVIAGGAIATILYIKSLLDSLKRKKEIEIEARGGLPKEAFQQGMIGEGGTMELKPEYGLPIPTTGRGRTAEEAGLIFRESSKSEETTPKLEFPSEINVEQLIINTSNVERASN